MDIKSESDCFGHWRIGILNLFVIWDLDFGIFTLSALGGSIFKLALGKALSIFARVVSSLPHQESLSR